MITEIYQLKKLIHKDLLLYLVMDQLEKMKDISDDPRIWNNAFGLSVLSRYMETEMEKQLNSHLKNPVRLRLTPEFAQQLLDFVRDSLNERESGQLAIYLNYLQSWIEQSGDWDLEQPIAFSRFEFS